jgi:N-acyl-D-aspartate/D-glutamate deacylase
VTFAPVRPGERAALAEMMEAVEDIPREAILEGLGWGWESYADYLDALRGTPRTLNVAGMVGHAALRVYVMGDRAVEGQATPEDLQAMTTLVDSAVRDGAAGFSSSRHLDHRLPDGRNIPGTHALHAELEAIAAAIGRAGGGLFQNVLNSSDPPEVSVRLLLAEAAACGRAIFSTAVGSDAGSGRQLAEFLDGAFGDANIVATCVPRAFGGLSGLVGALPLTDGGWAALAASDPPARLSQIRTASVREQLLAEAAASTPRVPFDCLRYLGPGPVPAYVDGPTLTALACEAGEHPAATWLRLADETAGAALFAVERYNLNIDAVCDLLCSPRVLPGLGDAGAHVSQVMDAGWPTFLLTHWVRATEVFRLEDAIYKLTAWPASILGVADRGRLAPGLRADVNVIDLEQLELAMPEMVADFPRGARRFIQRAQGYAATIVNGAVTLVDGEVTGERAGSVVRPS